MTQQQTPSPSPFWRDMGVIFMARLWLSAGGRIVYPFLGVLATGLGLSVEQTGALVTLRTIAGFAAPILAPLSDTYGRRRIMSISLITGAATFALLALVPLPPVAALSFLGMGLALTTFGPAMYAYIGDRVPYARRGTITGLNELAWALAWLIGVPMSTWLMLRFSWRTPWLAFAVLTALGALLVQTMLPPAQTPAGTSHPQSALDGRALWHLWHTVWRIPTVRWLFLGAFFLSAAIETPFIVYSVWLQDLHAISIATLGFASTFFGLAEGAAELASALFTDRLGKLTSVALGILLLAGAVAALPWLAGRSLTIAVLILSLSIFGLEFGLVSLLPIASEAVPQQRAAVVGLVGMGLQMGRTLGGFLGSWLWQWEQFAIHTSVAAMFAISSLFCIWHIRQAVQYWEERGGNTGDEHEP